MSLDRTIRAQRLMEHRALRREVRKNTFLREWLTAAEDSSDWFKSQNFSDKEVEEMARSDGYRTARSWLEMRSDGHRTIKQFVHADEYQVLWRALKEHDNGTVGGGYAYSPLNGGVPSRLLDSIQRWHKLPKFTTAERKNHSEKIAAAAEKLEDLLGQLVPSDNLDPQYSQFLFPDKQQAIAVLRRMGKSGEEIEAQRFPSPSWEAGIRLSHLGIEPLWAVQNIRMMASDSSKSYASLPTKVHTKTAKRTWFIRAVYDAICGATFSTPKNIGLRQEDLAGVVGLLTNADCSADDVRKALGQEMA